ncbi:hypothetical protein [Zobellella denitrificans]|nr:hypothetical protein [Zobellella denitrificans]
MLACEEDYLGQFARQQGVARFSAMLSQRQPLAALSGSQGKKERDQAGR